MEVCVDLDMSLSWLSANKFLKIWQLIGAGSSDWRPCHERIGSGSSSRAWSKGWLMTVSIVYLTPFVALSLQLTMVTWLLLNLLCTYSTQQQSNRFCVIQTCTAEHASSWYLIWILRWCPQTTNCFIICLQWIGPLLDPGLKCNKLSEFVTWLLCLNQLYEFFYHFWPHKTTLNLLVQLFAHLFMKSHYHQDLLCKRAKLHIYKIITRHRKQSSHWHLYMINII